MAGHSPVPYQFSTRTSREPDAILDDLAGRGLAGIGVDERGPSYIVLRPRKRYNYTSDTALMVGIGILIAVLLLTALTPVLIILLPVAAAPAIPLYLDHRPMLAVAAVVDEDGLATRVTVHGQASPELAAGLDAYLGQLPAASTVAVTESATR